MAEYTTNVAQDTMNAVQLEIGNNQNELYFRKPFDPVSYDLENTFRLTKFADLKGRGCKVPQEVLSKLLLTLQQSEENGQEEEHANFMQLLPQPRLGIGMDSSVTPLRHNGLSLVQTTDCIYPIVDEPYMMGKIACSNVLSDLYALGVTDCDNMLMILGVSIKMTEKERDVVIPLIMKGFRDCAAEAGTFVTGGHTVVNPWCTLGGVATSICQMNEYIECNNAVVGDVIVLTKPLGTQVAVNAHQWLEQPDRWNRIKLIVSEEDVNKAYQRAMDSMARLNRTAARLMHKYNAHGATDVTGFGLLGHAQALAKNQKKEVSFVIHNLPIIAKMASVAKACGNMFQLLQGSSPETSGGLLICLPREQAAAYCKDIEKQAEMLQRTVKRFGDDLNTISDHIKDKTMSQIKSTFKKLQSTAANKGDGSTTQTSPYTNSPTKATTCIEELDKLRVPTERSRLHSDSASELITKTKAKSSNLSNSAISTDSSVLSTSINNTVATASTSICQSPSPFLHYPLIGKSADITLNRLNARDDTEEEERKAGSSVFSST